LTPWAAAHDPKTSTRTSPRWLAPELRWREWMGRVEAVIFASKEPVSREVLARVVGPDCNLDLVIEDIRAELRGRPYDLVAGGWHLRTRKQFADAIHLAMGRPSLQPLSRTENLVLTAIAYFQPITPASSRNCSARR
jgi:segregation and condensation protein B